MQKAIFVFMFIGNCALFYNLLVVSKLKREFRSSLFFALIPLFILLFSFVLFTTNVFEFRWAQDIYFVLPLVFTYPCVAWTSIYIKKLKHIPLYSQYEDVTRDLVEETQRRSQAELELLKLNSSLEKLAAGKTAELQAILDSSPLAIIKLSSEGQVTLWNQQAEILFGWKAEEVLGRPVPVIPPHKISEFKSLFQNTLTSNRVGPVETQRLHMDGHLIDVSIWNAPINHVDSKVREALAIFADISERKRIEKDLDISRRELAESQRIACIGGWHWDLETDKVTWSDELFSIFDLVRSGAELNFSKVLELHIPESREKLRGAVERTRREALPYELELEIFKQGNKRHWVQARGEAIRHQDGSIVALRGTAQDINKRKRQEIYLQFLSDSSKALAETFTYEERLELVANLVIPQFAEFAVVHIQEENHIVAKAVSHKDAKQIESLLECAKKRTDLSNEKFGPSYALKNSRPQLVSNVDRETLNLLAVNDSQLELLIKLNIHSLLFLPLESRGRILGCLTCGLVDQTRTYYEDDVEFLSIFAGRAALQLDNANLWKKEKQATKDREHVLSIVSHDLKSPLATIQLSQDLLRKSFQDRDLDPKAQRYFSNIDMSLLRMKKLISDLLLFAKFESGTFNLQKTLILVDELLLNVTSQLSPQALAKNINLSFVNNPSIEIQADSDRLEQVLINLLDNALKFTPEYGKVEINSRAHETHLLITVQDTGPGIASEQLDKVFQKYWQEEDKAYLGTGLGLSIAKSIIEAHDGSIWVESELGKGSKFCISLPLSGRR